MEQILAPGWANLIVKVPFTKWKHIIGIMNGITYHISEIDGAACSCWQFSQYLVAKRMLQYATALKCLSLEPWFQISLDRKYVHTLVHVLMQIVMSSLKNSWGYSILIYLTIQTIWKVAWSCPASQWTPCEDSLEHFQHQMRKKRSTDYFTLKFMTELFTQLINILSTAPELTWMLFVCKKCVHFFSLICSENKRTFSWRLYSCIWFVHKAVFPLNSYTEITLMSYIFNNKCQFSFPVFLLQL
jgi:hypothetical protein